tara:strand:- start:10290 stop:10487 length:198 start_codon:yes stop_codon:yes gene_type:complete
VPFKRHHHHVLNQLWDAPWSVDVRDFATRVGRAGVAAVHLRLGVVAATSFSGEDLAGGHRGGRRS